MKRAISNEERSMKRINNYIHHIGNLFYLKIHQYSFLVLIYLGGELYRPGISDPVYSYYISLYIRVLLSLHMYVCTHSYLGLYDR